MYTIYASSARIDSINAITYNNLPSTSTSRAGVVQLIDTYTSAFTTLAPTANALTQVANIANSKVSSQWITIVDNHIVYSSGRVGIGYAFAMGAVPEGHFNVRRDDISGVYANIDNLGNTTNSTSNLNVRAVGASATRSIGISAISNYYTVQNNLGSNVGLIETNFENGLVISSNTTLGNGIRLCVGAAYTERMRITPSGNVGIGTTNPTEKMHVSDGNILCSGNITSKGGMIVDRATLKVIPTLLPRTSLTIPSSAVPAQTTTPWFDVINNLTYTFTIAGSLQAGVTTQGSAWIFDNDMNTTTTFYGYDFTSGYYTGNLNTFPFFQIQFDKQFVLTSYTTTYLGEGVAWYVLGSMDGINWIELSNEVGIGSPNGPTTSTYNYAQLDNIISNGYTYYRYEFPSIKYETSTTLIINELKLYGYISYTPIQDYFSIECMSTGWLHAPFSKMMFNYTNETNTTSDCRFCIQNDGNIGIKTSNPTYTLDVIGDSRVSERITTGAIVLTGYSFGTDTDGGNFADPSSTTNTYIKFGNAGSRNDWAYLRQIGTSDSINIALDFFDDPSDAGFVIRDVSNAAGVDTFNERFKVQRGGNVGIGVTNPNYKLDVNGTINATTYNNLPNASVTVKGIVTLNNTLTSTSQALAATANAVKLVADIANSKVSSQWITSTTNISYNIGNVGIGSSNPSYKLDVNGTINATSLNVTGISTSTTLYINNLGSTSTQIMVGKAIDMVGNNITTTGQVSSGTLNVTGIATSTTLNVSNINSIGTQIIVGKTLTLGANNLTTIGQVSIGSLNVTGITTSASLNATMGLIVGNTNQFVVNNLGAITNVASITSQGGLSGTSLNVTGISTSTMLDVSTISSTNNQINVGKAIDMGTNNLTTTGQVTTGFLNVAVSSFQGIKLINNNGNVPSEIYFDKRNSGATQHAAIGMDGSTNRNFFIWVNGSDRLLIDTSGNVRIPTSLTVSGIATSVMLHAESLSAVGSQINVGKAFNMGGNNITTTGQITTDTLTTSSVKIRSFNKSLALGDGSFTEFCSIVVPISTYTIHLNVVQNQSGSGLSRAYIITTKYKWANTLWFRVNPLSSSGSWGPNNFAVDIQISDSTCKLRLVRIGLGNDSTNITCTVIVYESMTTRVSINELSVTGSGASNNGLYETTSLTQIANDGVGNVGIGTDTPLYNLHVTGSVGVGPTGKFQINNDGAITNVTYVTSQGQINAPSINVTGIATSATLNVSTISSSNNQINVGKAVDMGTNNLTTTGQISATSYNNLPIATISEAGIVRLIDTYTSAFSTLAPTANALKQVADIANMKVSSQWITTTNNNIFYTLGNVGIGGSNPSYKLDVNGSLNCTSLNVNGQAFTGGTEWTKSATNISYNIGNVGIGSTNPSYKLDVNGTLNCTSLIVNDATSLKNTSTLSLGINALVPSILTIPSIAIQYGFQNTWTDLANGMTYTFTNQGANGMGQAWIFDNANTTTYFDGLGGYNSTTGAYGGTAQSTNGIIGAWFQIQSNIPFTLTSYSQSNAYYLTWYIFGSLNGVNWTEVNMQNFASVITGNNTMNYDITNTNAYTYYRYVINKSIIGSTSPSLVEIKFYGFVTQVVQKDMFSIKCLSYNLTTTSSQMVFMYNGGGIGTTTTLPTNIYNLCIQDNGNIGIGTANPSYKLDVNGTINATTYNNLPNASATVKGVVILNNTLTSTSTALAATANAVKLVADIANSKLSSQWITSTTDISYHIGNVGIGITNPSYKLDVNGTINATTYNNLPNASATAKGVVILNNTLTSTSTELAATANAVKLVADIANSKLSSQWITSTTNISYHIGNVGIGITNPSYKLDVNGSLNCTNLFVNSGTITYNIPDVNITTEPSTYTLNGITYNFEAVNDFGSWGGKTWLYDGSLSSGLTFASYNSSGTYTTTGTWMFTTNGISGAYFGIYSSTPFTLYGYTITSSTSVNMKRLVTLGTNDNGTTWTIVNDYTLTSIEANLQTYTRAFANSSKYQKYRVIINTTNSGNTSINEIKWLIPLQNQRNVTIDSNGVAITGNTIANSRARIQFALVDTTSTPNVEYTASITCASNGSLYFDHSYTEGAYLFNLGTQQNVLQIWKNKISTLASVGIGTTDPQSKLHIHGNVNISNSGTINFDTTANATAGVGTPANKIALYNSGGHVYGFGMENSAMTYHAKFNHTFYCGDTTTTYGSKILHISDGTIRVGNSGSDYYIRSEGQLRLWACDGGNGSHYNMVFCVGNSTSTNGDHIFYTKGDTQERMRITCGGNVGIGTSNPQQKLHVYQNQSGTSTTTTTIYCDDAGVSETGVRIGTKVGAGDFKSLSAYNNGIEVFTVRNSNVGINMTNPTERLNVDGNIKCTGGVTTQKLYVGGITENASDLNNYSPVYGLGYHNYNVCLSGWDGLKFFTNTNATNTNERMCITSAGYVGVGTTNPQEKLHVNGKVNASSFGGDCITDAISTTSSTVAASATAVKTAYNLANGKYTAAAATSSTAGLVKINDSTSSSSTDTAACLNSVKTAYDHANRWQNATDTNKIYFGTTGKSVGINSNIPSSALDVNGTVRASALAGDCVNEILKKVYPVGSIYVNASNNTNPNTLLGFGVWVAFGAGRVMVGIDSTDTSFNSAGETGGSKTLQSHTHNVTVTVTSGGDHNHGGSTGTGGQHNHQWLYNAPDATASASNYSRTFDMTDYGNHNAYTYSSTATYVNLSDEDPLSSENLYTSGANDDTTTGDDHSHSISSSGNHNHGATASCASTGAGNSENLQPYIVVYMWKRTS